MSVFDWIELAGRELYPLGVRGLELYPGFLSSESPEYLRTVRQALGDCGFAMPMLCASPDFTHPDSAERERAVDQHKGTIDLAAQFGARTCRVLSGQRRPEVGREEGLQWVVECIEALIPHAQESGVVLALENHFKDNYWTYPEFAQKTDLFCEIVDRIQSPWFGVNYDPSNALIANENPLELLERVKHRVVSVHASDRRPRPEASVGAEGITDYSQLIHGEVGTGLNDFGSIFGTLRASGFDGWVSIEDGVNGIQEMQRSAQFLAEKMTG